MRGEKENMKTKNIDEVIDPADGAINLATLTEEKLSFLSLIFPYMHASELDGGAWERVPIEVLSQSFTHPGADHQLRCHGPESMYQTKDFNVGKRKGTFDEPGNYIALSPEEK
jgi:hypothetical protein